MKLNLLLKMLSFKILVGLEVTANQNMTKKPCFLNNFLLFLGAGIRLTELCITLSIKGDMFLASKCINLLLCSKPLQNQCSFFKNFQKELMKLKLLLKIIPTEIIVGLEVTTNLNMMKQPCIGLDKLFLKYEKKGGVKLNPCPQKKLPSESTAVLGLKKDKYNQLIKQKVKLIIHSDKNRITGSIKN